MEKEEISILWSIVCICEPLSYLLTYCDESVTKDSTTDDWGENETEETLAIT